MARVNISLPDDLLARARSEMLNVSRVAAAAPGPSGSWASPPAGSHLAGQASSPFIVVGV